MKDQRITLPNGSLSKLYYDQGTPPRVAELLERYLHTNNRVRIWYGDTETSDLERVHGRKPDPGKDWGEEHDVTGTIGNSMGPIKIPLMINNARSTGGGAILTSCIVRVFVNGREAYRHPNYHSDYDHARVEPSELTSDGYTHAVIPYTGEYAGQEVARFRSEQSARNYLAFMRGERMSK